ncbi:MAG: site-specific integrase [Oscillospiraceae bacterium]
MASIRPRMNTAGEIISYEIRVHKGYSKDGAQLKPYAATFKPDPAKTAKQNEKALNKFVVEFEEKCKSGLVADTRQTFAQYAEYVIALKERTGVKHSTITRYRDILKRINEGIGHLKLADIRPQHLNVFYEQISKAGMRKNTDRAASKTDLKKHLKEKHVTQAALSERSGVSLPTLYTAVKGKSICKDTAYRIAATLNEEPQKLFSFEADTSPLSNKTICEHHRIISTILNQADKELLIPYNPAAKATPPKPEKTQANYFQIEDIEHIRDCLEAVSLKWRAIVHLLLISGVRRSEIAGLKWECVDWKHFQIHICRNILYAPDIGVYEDSTKNESSDRWVKLPPETMELLKQYRLWYMEQSAKYGSLWHNSGFLFFQEKSGNEGKPMNPDTINAWLVAFSERNGLPHINPHAFRHTMASVLYFNGVDSISISKRLGHSKVSTTTDIYSHIMKEADEKSAECIADVILRGGQDKKAQ